MIDNLLALVVATAVLVAIPGPNVALIVATSLSYGFRDGAVTVFGTTLGVALQLAFVVLGMAVVVEFAAGVLAWIRWAGVVYLVYLGVRTWRAPEAEYRAPERDVFWRGCLVAALNPKTLLFNAAFLPQFVPTDAGVAGICLVAAGFLAVLLVGDLLWAAFASSARRGLARLAGLRQRLTGAFFVLTGIGLALSRRDI